MIDTIEKKGSFRIRSIVKAVIDNIDQLSSSVPAAMKTQDQIEIRKK